MHRHATAAESTKFPAFMTQRENKNTLEVAAEAASKALIQPLTKFLQVVDFRFQVQITAQKHQLYC